MVYDKGTRVCRAADPATCRYHRSGVFAKDAVEMYFDGHEFWSSEGRAKAVAVKTDVLTFAEEFSSRISEGLSDGSLKLDDRRFVAKASALADASMRALAQRGSVSNAFFGDVAYGALVRPVLYQFNRLSPSVKVDDNVFDAESDVTPFDRSAGSMLAAKGGWVNQWDDGYYGSWKDDVATAHFQKCGPAVVRPPEEDSWESFAGTFADDANHNHGMTAEAECNCGALKGKLRVEGNFTDLTRSLVNDYASKVFDRFDR